MINHHDNPKLVIQSQLFRPRLSRAQCQELLAYLFASALLLLLVMGAGIAYHYALPLPQWVTLGNIAQFPIERPVHIITRKANVWIVNTGQEFLVFHAVPNDLTKCRIYWEAARQRFSDPCRGSRYTIRGIFDMQGPAPTRSLDRYVSQVDANGDLSIELTKPIVGLPWQFMKEACAIQLKRNTWNRENYWVDYCNFDLIGLELIGD